MGGSDGGNGDLGGSEGGDDVDGCEGGGGSRRSTVGEAGFAVLVPGETSDPALS